MAEPKGTILLYSDVIINNTYDHSIDFKNADEQYSYWRSFLFRSLEFYTYIRANREYISVEIPLKDIDKVNYLSFVSEDDGRRYYAFVTDKQYVNPETTNIFFEVDVLQTFMFDYQWRESYIARGHVDRWTKDGKPIFSLTNEDLNYGEEYQVETAFRIEQDAQTQWLLVTMTEYTPIMQNGFSTQASKTKPVPSTFASLLVPVDSVVVTCENGFDGLSSSTGSNPFDDNAFITYGYSALITGMLNGAIGDYVKTISLLTYNPFVMGKTDDGYVVLNPLAEYGFVSLKLTDDYGATPFVVIKSAPEEFFAGTLAVTDWKNGVDIPSESDFSELKKNPQTTKRDKKFESKLLCNPYRYNLLADWRNDAVVIKNEYLPDEIEVRYSMAISHNAPFRFYIKGYRGDPEGRNACLSQILASEFPIVSDEYSAYMTQNRNTLQANIVNAQTSAIGNIVASTFGGAMGGAGGGAKGMALGAASSFLTSSMQNVINYEGVVRSQIALKKDLMNRPDRIINSVDSAFNIIDGTDALTFYRMKITDENAEILADYFNMYGYTVNRLAVPDTKSRARFNYIKTIGANVVGGISQIYLAKIKEIYDNGVTLWHYSTEFKPLDYSIENIEVNLL